MAVALCPCEDTWQEVSYLILQISDWKRKKVIVGICSQKFSAEDDKHFRENCVNWILTNIVTRTNLNAAVHHGLCQSLRFHLCWIDSVERNHLVTITTGWYQNPYTQLERIWYYRISCSLNWWSEVVTDLRLSSAPPTTTMLLSALSFSLNSSMPSMLHCRAFWPTTNNTGVFMSSSGSSTSCKPVTH